jgi:hypothetical protein
MRSSVQRAGSAQDTGHCVAGKADSALGARSPFVCTRSIPTLPAATNGTFAYGINNNGHIVGYYGDSNGNHGFLETTVPNPPPPPGTTADMILRGSNLSPAVAGQYEIYDIGNNAILAGYQLGQVGTDNWQLGGFAVDPPTVSGTFADMSNDQLVQAMAGFGGGSGAGESLNTAPLGAETSQQPLLTTPQHA